jgi:hypothetical protein
MAKALHIPKLVIRSISFKKDLNYKDEARPQISVDDYTLCSTPRSRLNKKDRLYFKFKDLLNNQKINSLYIIELINSKLDAKKLRNSQIKNHFGQLNTLSVKWWNLTHLYIYNYIEVADAIQSIIDLEAFPLKKINFYDIV